MKPAPPERQDKLQGSEFDLSGALFELFMQAPTPLAMLTGPEHRFTLINPLYVQLARRSSGEGILGKTVREALPELEGQGFFELLDGVYRTGVAYIGSEVPGTLYREETGVYEDVFFNFIYQPIRHQEIRGGDGQVRGIMVQATDVTEQVRARQESERREQILHRQWSELESIYRTAPVGLCLVNARTFEFMRANDVQSQMNGLPVDQMIGRSVRAVAPAVADDVEALFRRIAAGHPVRNMQIGGELPHQPGVRHEWIVNYFPIYDEDGNVEAISCVTLEVTAQRRAESALRASEARYNAMYSTSLESIGLLTPDGRIIDCNRALLAFAGSTHEEVLGQYFWDSPWFRFTPGGPALCRDAIERAAAGELVRTELSLTRPTGEIITFDFSLCPVRNAQGEVEFLVPEGRDITDLKRIQSALIQSEKLAAVGRLASSVAHEINNPLEAVTNLIFLARKDAVAPYVQELLDMADQELRRVSIIANQTLRFHKQASNPQAITCTELFASVINIYQGKLNNSRITLDRERLRTQSVTCFQGDIRQVLLNVVGNAIDAMQYGGRLVLRSREAMDWRSGRRGVVITIADTGTGIAPEMIGSVFEPFFTTKGFSGTGLGLWISQEIMERHQGRIQIRSSQHEGHRGTVVSLFLPQQTA